MAAYILRRILLMIPTMIGIMLVSFAIVQFAPGGPIEKTLARIQGTDSSLSSRVSGDGGDFARGGQQMQVGSENLLKYSGSRGLDPAFIAKLEKQYGFDKPAHERFLLMMWNYLRFDFGQSFFRDTSVVDLVKEKLPVSITLGLWTTLISYLVSIPLGIGKAVRDGSRFDVWSSTVIVVLYSIPGFLFGILLIVLFAGGSFWSIFPLKGLWSERYDHMAFLEWVTAPGAIGDYLWHIALPVTAISISAFATSTLLTKNLFLDEIRKQYVVTARMKGLSETRILYGHVFRNAMLLVIAGFPAAFIGVFFGSSFLIENIFSLDGLGLLSFNAIGDRDYPIVFGTLYVFSLIGIVVNLLSDLMYTWIDPRIDFETRET
jgi:microcin C transport system permease protein